MCVCLCVCGGVTWIFLTVSVVFFAAAVRPHPESAANHVHRGLLAVPRSSAAGPGDPHHLQVGGVKQEGGGGETVRANSAKRVNSVSHCVSTQAKKIKKEV